MKATLFTLNSNSFNAFCLAKKKIKSKFQQKTSKTTTLPPPLTMQIIFFFSGYLDSEPKQPKMDFPNKTP